MSNRRRNIISSKLSLLLSFTLVVLLVFSGITTNEILGLTSFGFYKTSQSQKYAFADEVSDAQTEYQKAEAALNQAKQEYNAEAAKAKDLKDKVSSLGERAVKAQKAKFEHQKVFNDLATHEYKNNSVMFFINLVLDSKGLDDLFKHLAYAEKILNDKIKAINEQEAVCREYDNSIGELNSTLDQYNAAMSSANEKLSKAQEIANNAASKLKNAQDAGRIKKQASDLPSGGGGGGDTPGQWKSGQATAYGGSSDPGSGTRTATGATITENSVGVAIPMSMPNYRAYFNHPIQIRYNGRTIMGVINDCGGLGGRQLDLQPGVFHFFGAPTCQAWGVRGVEYVIL